MKLLAEAGFTRQGDRLVGPDGKPLQFKLMYNNSSEIRKRIASYVRDAYAKAGILVEPDRPSGRCLSSGWMIGNSRR